MSSAEAATSTRERPHRPQDKVAGPVEVRKVLQELHCLSGWPGSVCHTWRQRSNLSQHLTAAPNGCIGQQEDSHLRSKLLCRVAALLRACCVCGVHGSAGAPAVHHRLGPTGRLVLQGHAAIELKDAKENVLLGQYHLQSTRDKFVAAKPLRQTSRPPASETVRWSQRPAAGGTTPQQDLF